MTDKTQQFLQDCKSVDKAAECFIAIHGKDKIKFCEEKLFIFNDETGMWSSNYYAMHNSVLKYIPIFGKWIAKSNMFKKLIQSLNCLTIDDNFLNYTQSSSLGKILFKNGYYDFKEYKFVNRFTPKIFFPIRISRDYNPDVSINDINRVKRILFEDPFENKETGSLLMHYLAEGLRGLKSDKDIIICVGQSDSGKSMLCTALCNTFGNYVGIFNGASLVYKGKHKEWFNSRYCRIIYTNNILVQKKLNGNILRMINSENKNSLSFAPHFTPLLMVNQIPDVQHNDNILKERIKVIRFDKRFSRHPQEGEMPVDESLQTMIKSAWFQDALFQILIE